VTLAAGSLASLFAFAALRDRSETVMVAVAREPIAAASVMSPSMVRWVEVPADSAMASTLVNRSDLDTGGLLAARPIAQGEPVTSAAVSSEMPKDGLRSMSVPVAREHAANGALQRGDRVDVIDLVSGKAVYVVTDSEVLAVGGDTAGSATARPGQFAVTLAVDADAALRLTEALADKELEVVRSTGATPAKATGDGDG
jgi:Flp pilus assembly protein CpaB